MKPAAFTTEKLEKSSLIIAINQDGSRQQATSPRGGNWLPVISFTLAAFLIRLLLIRFRWGLGGDGAWYATLGKNLISGNFEEGLSPYWPPFYPMLVGISSLIFRDLEFASVFVSVVAGGLLVIPVYYLCLKIYSREVAFIGALLVIIHPLLVSYSTTPLTESTYTLVFATALLLGLFALSKGRSILFLLAGLAYALCYLTRPEAIAYIALMTLITLGQRLYNKRIPSKKVLLHSALLVAGFFLLASPYILYVHHRTGEWTISQKLSSHFRDVEIDWRRLTPDGELTHADILWGNVRPQTPTRVQSSIPHPAGDSGSQPGRARRFAQTLRSLASGLTAEYRILPRVVSHLFLLLAGLGLFTVKRSKAEAGYQTYLLLFLLATLLGYSLTVLQPRFLLPLLPIFLCWSAKGVIIVETWLGETFGNLSQAAARFFREKKIGRTLVLTVLVLSMLPLYEDFVNRKSDEARSVAEWIKEHSDTSSVVMAANPWAAFWSGVKHLYLPDEAYPVVLDYARRKGVKYLVIEEQQIEKTPNLKFLLNEQSQHPDLKLVHKYDGGLTHSIYVYELVNLQSLPNKRILVAKPDPNQ